MRNFFIILLIAATGLMLYPLYEGFSGSTQLSELGAFYANPENITKVNSANLVTAVVVSYRGLDTLGEVTILFLTAAIIAFFLKHSGVSRKLRVNSEIFVTASNALVPVMILMGIYVFINGHLSPGGGFQGGAIIASAVILILLASPEKPFNTKFFAALESVSGLVFVVMAALGAALGSGFLDNAILPLGKLGSLLSAGAIPVIYSFVGLKVGAELANIVHELKAVQTNNEAN